MSVGERGGWVCGVAALMIALAPGAAVPASAPDPAKQLKLPVDRTLAVYVPAGVRRAKFYLAALDLWLTPGKALEDASQEAGRQYFRGAALTDLKPDEPYNLLLVTHPKWELKDKQPSRLTVVYKLLDAHAAVVTEGAEVVDAKNADLLQHDGFHDTSLQAMQQVLAKVALAATAGGGAGYTDTALPRDLPPSAMVSRDKPVASGTGFYINPAGQVMTAAHVVHDCLVTEVRRDGKVVDAKPVAESLLLDLAVIDTGAAAEHFIPLRQGTDFVLGEPVTNVGFPLEGVLAGSPNLTRGNISSRTALTGAHGLFQFSAPIQPGSSGGPVVSDGGELLGITVSTLNVTALIQKGVLPQNVNFALDARYAANFMRRHQIDFRSVPANAKGDLQTANAAALPAVVQLACFQ